MGDTRAGSPPDADPGAPSPTEGRAGASGRAGRAALGANYWKLLTASAVSNLGDGLSLIAYPWLASALTRHPVAIAGVAVAARLPWLLFTLPAGVVTDRVDRRRLIVAMDLVRFALTLGVAVVVLTGEGSLNDPALVADGTAGVPTGAPVALAALYLAAVAIGTAEVFRDNAAQTLMPSLVRPEQLERANGRLWGVEMVLNQFVGPPLAGFLLGTAFALPFFVDAGTFAVSGLLVLAISGSFRPRGRAVTTTVTDPAPARSPVDWRAEVAEGVGWLRRHALLRSVAISLGALNFLGMLSTAAEVLFAQEVLGLSATGYGVLVIGAAIGGVAGALTGDRVSARLGPGRCLFSTILIGGGGALAIALLPRAWLFFVVMMAMGYVATLWNVITVALRQTIIPDQLLGRVNSVYRLVGWGVIPLGALIGGLLVTVVDLGADRGLALRAPFLVSAVGHAALLVYAVPRLTTERIERAKAEAR